MLTSLAINIRNIQSLLNPDSRNQLMILCTDWVVFAIMLIGMILSRLLKRLDLVLPTLVIIMLKHYLVSIDTDGLRNNKDKGEEIFQLAYQITWIILTQLFINSVATNLIVVPFSFMTATCITIKVFLVEHINDEKPILDVISTEYIAICISIPMLFLFFLWVHAIMIYSTNELIMAWSQRDILLNEISSILNNL